MSKKPGKDQKSDEADDYTPEQRLLAEMIVQLLGDEERQRDLGEIPPPRKEAIKGIVSVINKKTN